MSEENKIIDTEIFGNLWIILSTSIVLLMVILWNLTEDSFPKVMIACSVTSVIVIGYWIYSSIKIKKQN
jgi:hypothetical protein